MSNRRDLISGIAAFGALMLKNMRVSSAENAVSTASRSLRMLILGGTGYIGPHFIQSAIARGHKVSVFTRAKSRAELPAEVEKLIGDRNGDLDTLKNRDWDAVFDLATYIPIWVRTLGQALGKRARHYTFISTESVYQFPGALDERSAVRKYVSAVDAYSTSASPKSTEEYGALKVLCEREAERHFPEKTLILRAGPILGPGNEHDPHHSYWAVRMKCGGEILVPGDPFARVQMIDVRDLAEWAIFMAERSETGVFNTVGPAMPMTWVEMLGGIRGTLSVPLTLTWISASWLAEKKVPDLYAYALQFWSSEAGMPGFMHMANNKALSKGLTFRPWSTTVASILAWYEALPLERQKDFFSQSANTGSLADFIAHEHDILTLWHAQQTKTSPRR